MNDLVVVPAKHTKLKHETHETTATPKQSRQRGARRRVAAVPLTKGGRKRKRDFLPPNLPFLPVQPLPPAQP